MKSKLNQNWCPIFALILVIAGPGTQAAEIKGTVRSVSDGTAAVAIEGELAPNVGDKAEIFFNLAGTDVSVATASVTKVEADAVQLKVENASGDVAKDQLVRITSANPQKRVAVSTPPPALSPAASLSPGSSPSEVVDANAGKDPGFAFVDMNQIFKDYPKTKSAEVKINDAKAAAKKDYDQRAANYRVALDEINALNKKLDSPTLSAAEKTDMAADRDRKIAAIKIMEGEINGFRAEREKDLQEQALKMREEIVSEIVASINRLATDKVELLFDRSGTSLNGVPVVVFTPREAEMSARVSAALQGQSAAAFEPTRGVMSGLIDMNRVFKYYSKTKDSEARINAAKEVAKKDYDKRAAAYKTLLDKINDLNRQIESANEKTKARLTKDRDTKITQIKTMEREINEFRKTRESQLQADALKMREGIVGDITAALSKRLSAERAPLIFDTSGQSLNGVPFVLSASGLPDLSDEVIAILNRTAPGSVSLASSTELKFGFVDMSRAFKAMPEFKQNETEINDLRERAKTETAGADAATRSNKEKEIQDIATKRREGMVRKLTETVGQVVRHEDLNLVFDSSGHSMNGVSFLVFTQNVPDLTDKIIAHVTGSTP